MKGNNILEANASTVIAAMQEYLDKRAAVGFPASKIDSVTFSQGNYRFLLIERKDTPK